MTTKLREEPGLGVAIRGLAQGAAAALTSIDPERLEELVRQCTNLKRLTEKTRTRLHAETVAQDNALDIRMLGGVLQETRANLMFFSRLHVIRIRAAELEIDCGFKPAASRQRLRLEDGYGDN